MRYYLTSYDQNSNEMVESIPTTQEIFEKVKEALGEDFDPYGDCFKITDLVYAKLNNITLDLSKSDYFLERSNS